MSVGEHVGATFVPETDDVLLRVARLASGRLKYVYLYNNYHKNLILMFPHAHTL